MVVVVLHNELQNEPRKAYQQKKDSLGLSLLCSPANSLDAANQKKKKKKRKAEEAEGSRRDAKVKLNPHEENGSQPSKYPQQVIGKNLKCKC